MEVVVRLKIKIDGQVIDARPRIVVVVDAGVTWTDVDTCPDLRIDAFPEGTVHVLRFSRNGALLLAGGGRGGQSGLAVVWDVKTGKRVFEVGKEYDAVLAADLSPDLGLVALGGLALTALIGWPLRLLSGRLRQ